MPAETAPPEFKDGTAIVDAAPFVPLPALFDAARDLVIDELHSQLRARGFEEVRPGHGCVFRFVAKEGSRLTHLAERAGMTKQAVGEVATELEKLGYVERVPDPSDRRAKLIRLTDRGHRAQSAAIEIFQNVERRLAEELGEDRIGAMRDLLEELVAVEL